MEELGGGSSGRGNNLRKSPGGEEAFWQKQCVPEGRQGVRGSQTMSKTRQFWV